jgi:xylulokinase
MTIQENIEPTSATLLGIDVGTSVIKACLIATDATCLAEVERPIGTHMPRAGVAEQDGAVMVAEVVGLLAELVARCPDAAGRVAAIGASGQNAGSIAVGHDGAPLTPWYPSALDTRIRPQLERMKGIAGAELFARNGAWPFTTPRMLWWRDTSPAVFERIACVPPLGAFIIGSLAEQPLAAMAADATTLTWYGAADLAARRWDAGLVRAFDVPEHILPTLVPSFSVVGALSEAIGAKTGLASGIPLAVGIGDTVASLIGANVLSPGEVYSVNGSFTNYLVCVDRCLVDVGAERYQPLASPLDDVWYAILYVAGGGFVHRQMAALLGGDFATLDAAAAGVAPGADGLLFMPYVLGRFCPPEPRASGGFHGLTLAHGRGEVWRAVLEGLTFDLLDLTEAVSARIAGWRPDIVRLTGGGAKSALWCQMQADMLGLPGERFRSAPSSPVGAALTAGVAVGVWPDLRTAAARIRLPCEGFTPNLDNATAYARLLARRRGLIEQLRPSWNYLAAG